MVFYKEPQRTTFSHNYNPINQSTFHVHSLLPSQFHFLGKKYLAWAYSDVKPKEDEDVKTHIRRENLELTNALAVLGCYKFNI